MLPRMKDMAKSKDEIEKSYPMSMPEGPIYPFGLCLSLDDSTLEKLGLDSDCEYGDMIHLSCMAKVTSATKSENGCRVELQIVMMGCENEEEEEKEQVPKMRLRSRYKE